METRYEIFSASDFLDDSFFIAWVKYPTPETEIFWNKWIASQPANLQYFRQAEEQLRIILAMERIEPETSEMDQVWNRISETIGSGRGGKAVIRQMKTWVLAGAIAASILVSGAVWYLMERNPTRTIVAKNGQLVKGELPDDSRITLNANSTVEYLSKWKDGNPREVFLKGEAYFQVTHLNMNTESIRPGERFIVHTEQVQVEVLGTSFNVKERRGITEVSLEKGSVRVQLKSDSSQILILKPGEVAEYNSHSKVFRKVMEDPVYHKDWTESKMLANNTTVAEIIRELEDVYGYKVILEDTSIAGKRIDGVIPFRNEENVLFVLSNMLDLDIEKHDQQLIIKKRKKAN